jgi:K+-transporting ATPase ATPase B chain
MVTATERKHARRRPLALFDASLLGPALVDSFRKLDPREQVRNPVMFVVFVGSVLCTWLWIDALRGRGEAPA